MPLTASRFVGPITVTPTMTVLATVPAGHRWLVRNVTWANSSTTIVPVVGLYLNGSTAAERLSRRSVPLSDTVLYDPWWTFYAGDVLRGQSIGANSNLTICGYDLLE